MSVFTVFISSSPFMTTLSNIHVVKANAKLRRFIFSFLVGIMTFGWAGIYISHHFYLKPHQPDPPFLNVMGHGLLLIVAIIALGLAVFGLWIGQLGFQSLRQGCYPPPNSMILCDTLWVTGWKATIKAMAALMLAVASLLATLGIGLEITAFLNL